MANINYVVPRAQNPLSNPKWKKNNFQNDLFLKKKRPKKKNAELQINLCTESSSAEDTGVCGCVPASCTSGYNTSTSSCKVVSSASNFSTKSLENGVSLNSTKGVSLWLIKVEASEFMNLMGKSSKIYQLWLLQKVNENFQNIYLPEMVERSKSLSSETELLREEVKTGVSKTGSTTFP